MRCVNLQGTKKTALKQFPYKLGQKLDYLLMLI